MIHKTVDNLIHKCGGMSSFIIVLRDNGVDISRSGVQKWYSSNQVNPQEKYRGVIEEIAKKMNLEIQFEAVNDDEQKG